jgi:hypothetical protein
MRNKSNKTARIDYRLKPLIAAFLEEFPFCWYCGSSFNVNIDHIISGTGGRPAAKPHRATFNAACGTCNTGKWSGSGEKLITDKYAIKRFYDPVYYNRPLCNALRGRDPESITEAMVDAAEAAMDVFPPGRNGKAR